MHAKSSNVQLLDVEMLVYMQIKTSYLFPTSNLTHHPIFWRHHITHRLQLVRLKKTHYAILIDVSVLFLVKMLFLVVADYMLHIFRDPTIGGVAEIEFTALFLIQLQAFHF